VFLQGFLVRSVVSEEKIVLTSIGYVKNGLVREQIRDKALVSQIILKNEFIDALDGIDGFSHLFVLFYLNRVTEKQRKTPKVHPRGREDLPLLGVFATRTMVRPNPIGLTLVQLLKVDGNVLTVQGLDAFEGTPVLDLKPYDSWDRAEDARFPEWWKKLEP
jgi:tRNA-Thr(GGU) m(6)t(6)A37 methyltransferase TsaA